MEIFHKGLPMTFLGLSTKRQEADVIVLSCPYDSTTSYGCGARAGPDAIIRASRQVELYDIELEQDITKRVKIFTEDELEVDKGNPERNCRFVEEAVECVLEEGKFPVLLGGEHSVSIGAFWAMEKKFGNELSVLQIDAHADMRQEYEGSKYSHACTMARCREILHAVSVGIRSYSEEEAEEIKKMKQDFFGVEFEADQVIERLKPAVYVTVDLDGFDPSEVPAVGTPEPGGLKYLEVLDLLRQVAKRRKIVGFDVVELAPIPSNVSSDFLAAKLAYKLIGYAHMK
ncbi:MAG: agmatinase [Candidatus Anstonellaceae archaeon]